MLEKFIMEFLFSSPEPKCQVSFSDHVCVNSYYNIVYHLTTNLYMSKHPGMKDCNVCSIEGQGALPRCKYIGNSENKEGSLRNLNLF